MVERQSDSVNPEVDAIGTVCYIEAEDPDERDEVPIVTQDESSTQSGPLLGTPVEEEEKRNKSKRKQVPSLGNGSPRSPGRVPAFGVAKPFGSLRRSVF